ncbi:MAG: valine--tRNA ligase [Hyphomicrobiales bacterium]|nr:valine--tRNA ligase [Rickettsiales bacterium]MCP5361076.1 valine--tRNA ligase [Hyphomicrobiales bacterium]
MKELPKQYDHKVTEKHWQQYWETTKTYAWDETAPRTDTFVIDTPPPTVSGVLHMGHIFSYTQADFVARYQRMSGKTVFYPMGFDDNGLPTERLVEKVKKINAHKYMQEHGREGFIELCEGVAEEARKEFRRLFESVALSVDWRQEYHTISEESRRISQLSFLDLFHKQHAYRKLQPMLWDPVDQTAIAQAEVVDQEIESHWNDITFGLEGSDSEIIIGTTRPELLAACVAVFYHPEDARYQHLNGKTAITPLFGVPVPILPDEDVQQDKGTGLVMCCTFGDEQDIRWWERHNLPTRVVLNTYGKLDFTQASDPADWASAPREAIEKRKTSNKDPKHPGAREVTLELLKEAGLLVKQEPITHAVNCAERSGAPLEILPTHQWFVRVLDKKDALKQRTKECTWYPDFMRLRCEQWIDGLNWDWCISRQRFFGVPFPVWYSKRAGEEGKILIADKDQLPVNPLVDLPKGYTREEVEAEADVMDTWATSSVSPQLSSKAISNEYAVDYARHQKLFPADLRPQAHEIIRTWAFYTIVKAHLHEETIPWKNLMISGWCLASDKTKMSKSKGNVVTPVDLIEEKGADVVRYWASTSRLGADTAFSEDVLKIGRKLVTKLWNASKFAAIQLEAVPRDSYPLEAVTEPLDRWVLTRLHRAIANATAAFEKFEYSGARAAVEDFFWNDFCDNYLEMIKGRAYGGEDVSEVAQHSAVITVYHCLEAVLRLFAPILPHITEELYSHIFAAEHQKLGSLHARGTWPKAEDYPLDETAEAIGIAARQILDVVRKQKAEANVSLKYPLTKLCIAPAGKQAGKQQVDMTRCLADLTNVTNTAEIVLGDATDGDLSEDENWRITIELAAEADTKTAIQ